MKTATIVKPTNPSPTMALPSCPSTAKTATTKHGSNASSLSTVEEEETSPTIRRILEKTGCSSRQELLAMRAAQEQQVNTNRNRSKSTTNRNGSKAAMNGAPNVAKTATKGAKATNPKKKAKSKYCNDTLETLTP